MSVCPDTDLQQSAAFTDADNMLRHTFCSAVQSRCGAVNKRDTNPQGKDKELFPPTHHKKSYKSHHPHFHSDLSCPVCLQTATSPVETNCGHLFCGSCLIEYWKHDPWLGAISCPLCRQKVHILYNDFCEIQQDKISRAIMQDIRRYNNRFSGKRRPLTDYLYDLPSLLHLALRRIFTMGGLVWIFCLRIVVCSFGAIRSLSPPFDVITDPMCRVLSTIDDLVVVTLLLICTINICQQFRSEGITVAQATAQSILSES